MLKLFIIPGNVTTVVDPEITLVPRYPLYKDDVTFTCMVRLSSDVPYGSISWTHLSFPVRTGKRVTIWPITCTNASYQYCSNMKISGTLATDSGQ